MKDLLQALCQGLYEREIPMKLALLSAVAGESIFLLGPPGVGKSLIARKLKFAFRDGVAFEYLMSRFSTPDEIFGPVSIQKLKEEDKYERLTDRYLPGATIVFLDEIWKSGPAIQNALLTILNEKIYRNGEEDIQVDIKGIITASNELPPQKESFQPLWDRFLIRYSMSGIKEQKKFLSMITDTQDVYQDFVPQEIKITHEEWQTWDQEINAIDVPPEILNTIQVIRIKLDEYNRRPNRETAPIQVYDRRWKKLIRLLRTSAFLNGRSKVDLMDCFLMVHCLWGEPSQLGPIQEIVSETIRKHGYSITLNLSMLRKEISALEEEVEAETRIKHTTSKDRLKAIQEVYYAFVQDEKQFQGELIQIEEFNKLSLDEFQVINVYDEERNLRHRLKAQKSPQAHAVEIQYNSVAYRLPLQTTQVEQTEIIYKAPHSLIAKHWDQQCAQLQTYISEQQTRLKEELPTEFDHLRSHLFVNPQHAVIIESNMREAAEMLDQLALRLEKVQYAYQSL